MTLSSAAVSARRCAASLGLLAVVSVTVSAQSFTATTGTTRPASGTTTPATPSDSARASALVADMRAAFHGSDLHTAVATAEQDLARLDSMPGVIPQKIMGHRVLQGYYGNFDIDDKLGANARTILALSKQLPASVQPRATQIVSDAYRDLASLQANELHPDSAIAILQGAPTAFPTIPSLKDELAPDIARYQMVGHKAPQLQADYWINRAAGASPVSWTDGVSVLVFTANWCHSCRDSYPTLTQLSKADSARGLHIVLAVALDGQFEGKKMTPDEEVAANREYYVTHHGFTYPIAIQQPSAAPGLSPAAAARNDEAFLVRALPQFIVIDRTGTIRAVLMGWDPYGHRQHALTTIVTQLLASRAVAQR